MEAATGGKDLRSRIAGRNQKTADRTFLSPNIPKENGPACLLPARSLPEAVPFRGDAELKVGTAVKPET
jgi:hypothetical protein